MALSHGPSSSETATRSRTWIDRMATDAHVPLTTLGEAGPTPAGP
jgi:hypothetical protein